MWQKHCLTWKLVFAIWPKTDMVRFHQCKVPLVVMTSVRQQRNVCDLASFCGSRHSSSILATQRRKASSDSGLTRQGWRGNGRAHSSGLKTHTATTKQSHRFKVRHKQDKTKQFYAPLAELDHIMLFSVIYRPTLSLLCVASDHICFWNSTEHDTLFLNYWGRRRPDISVVRSNHEPCRLAEIMKPDDVWIIAVCLLSLDVCVCLYLADAAYRRRKWV